MSSPESRPEEGRHLTIIVVPHNDLETRSFVVSYAKLKVLLVLGTLVALLLALGLAFLFPVMAQAARASQLEEQLEALEQQRAEVEELAETLKMVQAQYERVREMLGADAPMGSDSAPLLPPLPGADGPAQEPPPEDLAPISLEMWPLAVPGYVTRGVSDGRSRHPGLDIAVPTNSYIRAASAGTVRAAGIDAVYGQYVVIDHGDRLETVYGHASRLLVTAGDRVSAGDVIALTGSTGRSTAPHLHFEVRRAGQAVDPLRYIRQP